jgi:hypothetical protein
LGEWDGFGEVYLDCFGVAKAEIGVDGWVFRRKKDWVYLTSQAHLIEIY